MYIKKEDFGYLEGLYKVLDAARRQKFTDILLKTVSKKAGIDISRIEVVGGDIFDVRGIPQGEIVTRTMIKKAYKATKEEI